jgi:hypothetical protein
MMIALERGVPDRLPITIHQWQPYHLERTMNGMDQLRAFQHVGLDASIETYGLLKPVDSADWRCQTFDLGVSGGEHRYRHVVSTPDGELCWETASDPTTTFITEHPVKTGRDAEVFLRHYPGRRYDREALTRLFDEVGNAGIVRGFVTHFSQCGPWQDFCELVGTQTAIFWAHDDSALTHRVLEGLTERRVQEIREHMRGLSLDLVECGGGAGSSTVISPRMFAEFCLPYDKRINEALRDAGLKSVYHTCGGMFAILDLIPSNGTDASETLSPPEVGGDLTPDRRRDVKERLGDKTALIGGVNQALLDVGKPCQVEADVEACFAGFGGNGGYICSASDHFFHAPVENLRAMTRAALRCSY